jgi:hypothetical protein
MQVTMLTTIDNPFDPFTQFDEWLTYDTDKGYHSCAYLARITKASDELSELDETIAIEEAIDEIIKENTLGIYKKVTRNIDDIKEDSFSDSQKTS